MDKQAYLDQLSASVRPTKSAKKSFFSSIIFKVLLAGVIILTLTLILGAVFSNINAREKTRSISLKLHIDNVSNTIKTYQPLLKSSALRSSSASLANILKSTSRDLTAHLETAYSYKKKGADKSLISKETTLSDKLNNELFEAKINGILDRTYSHKMAYEISILTTHESELIKTTKSPNLKVLLENSHQSLSNLYSQFDNFSETK